MAQDSVDITVEGTIMSPVALAEMKILTEGSFGSVARSPNNVCRYLTGENDVLHFAAAQGTYQEAPGFNSGGCGALYDNVLTPTISYTCPVDTYVQIRTRRDTFNTNDYAEFQGLYGAGNDRAYVSAARSNQGGGVFEFNTYCHSGNDEIATRTVTLFGQVLLRLESGTPETDESFSVTLPLEIQY
ncbi:hypothetical protein [Ponticaulis sp.]|uniref:hypothetical protein n=1 Tax=Ponticaulis sp. TaxID=2020902 RepID=UPI00263631CC|nr:hypothetical protein [Ponticaulis sp.]MDF1679670.1 hypothetical protein [Ponticaulis sp.]